MSLASRFAIKTAKKKVAKAAAKVEKPAPKPKAEKPLAAKPTGGKPLAAKPTGGKPAATAPAKPKTEKSLAAKPKDKPPSLLSAIRFGGKTYTGKTHLDALDAIPNPEVRKAATLDGNTRGFVNERGRFMDRYKAADYARDFDLFSPDAPSWARTAPEVISENLKLPESLEVKPKTEKPLAAKPTKKKAVPVVKGLPNPLHEVSLEFGPEVARRLDGLVDMDAPLSEWREAAARLAASDVANASRPVPSPYSVRPADVAQDPRIESRKGELGKIENLELGVAPRVTDPAPEVSIFDFEGHPFITSMSDLAAAGDDLISINDVPFRVPFSRRGGQGYMFDNPGSVWASERKPAEKHVELAKRLQELTGKDVLYMPWTMGPNAVRFSHMPRGIQYSYADAALDAGDRNALASEIRTILPDWQSFEDPDSAEMFMRAAGKSRGALNTLMDRFRTAVNVWGDTVGVAVVDTRWGSRQQTEGRAGGSDTPANASRAAL